MPDSNLPILPLNCVVEEIDAQLTSSHNTVQLLLDHVSRYRGKMLRPQLVLLAGQALGLPVDDVRLIRAAAVMELIHLATLVHDDVMDEANMRRGGKTVHTLCGNESAVMLGDMLISHAYLLCSKIGDSRVSLAVSEASCNVCEGELLQLQSRCRFDLTLQDIQQICEGKTGALTGGCMQVAGIIAGVSSDDCLSQLKQFGVLLGLAFQVADDVLDVSSTDAEAGKSTGRDLAEGKMTLPLILARRYTGESLDTQLEILAGLKSGDLIEARGEVDRAIQDSNAIVESQIIAKKWLDNATECLQQAIPDETKREPLSRVVGSVLNRRR